MTEITVYGKKFKPNVFGQLTVESEIEQSFIKDCDSAFSNISKKEITAKFRELLKKYPFKEVTGRTVWKIHGRNYKPAAKIRAKKGHERYTPEDKQLFVDRSKAEGLGPKELSKLELLKDRRKRNPSIASISNWIRRAAPTSTKKSRIDQSVQDLIISIGKHKPVKEIIGLLRTLPIKVPCRKTIENILEMNGISVSQGKSQNEKVYICETALKYGIPKTPAILEREGIKTSQTRIRGYFHDLGIKLPDTADSHRKYALANEDFFDVINTEEKAYWLGFIAADGAVRDGKLLEIELKRSDKNHLLKFTKALGTNKNIYETLKIDNRRGKSYPAAKIAVFSKQLVMALSKYNIIQNKTKTYEPKMVSIPLELHCAFWRGYFDGDGVMLSESAINPNYLEFTA